MLFFSFVDLFLNSISIHTMPPPQPLLSGPGRPQRNSIWSATHGHIHPDPASLQHTPELPRETQGRAAGRETEGRGRWRQRERDGGEDEGWQATGREGGT